MAVADWRAWTDQNGGQIPTAATAPGVPPTAFTTNSPFPGVLPLGTGASPPAVPAAPGKGDLVDGGLSFPTYPNVPATVNAIDPFYYALANGTTTYPSGGGWVAQWLLASFTGGIAGVPPSGTGINAGPGSAVPAGPIMRPAVAGITTP